MLIQLIKFTVSASVNVNCASLAFSFGPFKQDLVLFESLPMRKFKFCEMLLFETAVELVVFYVFFCFVLMLSCCNLGK